MPFQPGAVVYPQSFGTRPESIEVPHYDVRNPTAMDWNYPVGKMWIYTGNSIWILLSITSSQGVNSAHWVQLTTGSPTVVSAGVTDVQANANQIIATNAAGKVALSIPATFMAPGSVVAATTLTAKLGNITASNGHLVLGTAGNKLLIAGGTNASVGTTDPLIAGSLLVHNTAITANSLVFFTTHTLSGVAIPQSYRVAAKVPGLSFTVQSSSKTDTSKVSYWIIN